MPNMQGGKKYKSSKHSQESKAVLHLVEEGQQIGRVLKVLGNKRMIVYCNDNNQRICRIRGALGKRSWIEKGDIVLISVREDLAAGTTGALATAKEDVSDERGDILEKYDHSVLGKLKKEDGMNPKVFLNLEAMEAGKIRADLENINDDGQEDLFEHEGETDAEEEKHETKPKSKDHRFNLEKEEEIDIDNI
jgi:translation initiation factor 1A